ncbi:MAG: MarR family transcriptional regulator [Bacilli bacterium]|nr:MarR family transcriptional regulator [Bacilli bacterium]
MKEKSVLFEIKEFQGLVGKELFRNNPIDIPISGTQHRILKYLLEHQEESIYQKDIEKKLNLSRATISGVLGTMEKHNLIKRTSSKEDTRTKKIELEENAKKHFHEGKKKIQEIEKVATEDLSQEEIQEFRRTLKRMKENIIRRNHD